MELAQTERVVGALQREYGGGLAHGDVVEDRERRHDQAGEDEAGRALRRDLALLLLLPAAAATLVLAAPDSVIVLRRCFT